MESRHVLRESSYNLFETLDDGFMMSRDRLAPFTDNLM